MYIKYETTLSDEDLKFAATDIGETKEARNNGLAEIVSWLNDNPEINGDKSARNVLCFLRSCKFDIERTKEKIRKYDFSHLYVPILTVIFKNIFWKFEKNDRYAWHEVLSRLASVVCQ